VAVEVTGNTTLYHDQVRPPVDRVAVASANPKAQDLGIDKNS
jgi:hypothetical protein